MHSRFSGLIGVLVGLGAMTVACKSDPLSDHDGTPAAISLDFAELDLAVGATANVTASVLDGRSLALEEPVTFTSRAAGTAGVAVDPTYAPNPATSSRAVVSALAAGATYVIATGAGLTDSVKVVVLPVTFDGALSSATPTRGDTLTISSTAVLKFDPATVSVSFPTAGAATIVSKTADAVKVLVPFTAAPGPLTISGIAVTYVAGLTVTLNTASSVTASGDKWAAASSWQTAPDISSMLPASGGTSFLLSTTTSVNNGAVCPENALGFGSTGPCMMFKFTLAAPATLNFTTAWAGTASAPDIDIYACSDSTVANFGTACFEDGGAGATGSLPQTTGNHAYPAGTHWFVIEIFGGGTTASITTTITAP
jgi:hypothetical protein